MRRRVSIFGSTGSIGQNTVDLIERQGGAEAFDIVALTSGKNITLLAEQAKRLRARFAVTSETALGPELAQSLAGTSTKALSGADALADIASEPVGLFVSAIVGAAGLPPTLNAAKSAQTLALANKESLVCAGTLLRRICREHGTRLLPVDSEHSAVFQALRGEKRESVARVILTASGGPFKDWSLEQMSTATPEQAVAHPNWSMGQRISIDSASMFNKALEVIEAKYLFDFEADQIEVVVHPQSIIHSMVEYRDGSIIAQMGAPDMRSAIGYALNYPDRLELPVNPLDFNKLSQLNFEQPDHIRFPALRLAYAALERGGLSGAVLNAAKEIALDRFFDREIGYLQMAELVEGVVEVMPEASSYTDNAYSLDDVLAVDQNARVLARNWKPQNRGIAGWS